MGGDDDGVSVFIDGLVCDGCCDGSLVAMFNSSSLHFSSVRDEAEELTWWILMPGMMTDGEGGVKEEMTQEWHRQCVSAMNAVVMTLQ